MARSKQSNETAKALVSPLFAISNAMLKGGEMLLDSMQAAARNARSVRVAVLDDVSAPTRRRLEGKSGNGRTRARRAKKRRR